MWGPAGRTGHHFRCIVLANPISQRVVETLHGTPFDRLFPSHTVPRTAMWTVCSGYGLISPIFAGCSDIISGIGNVALYRFTCPDSSDPLEPRLAVNRRCARDLIVLRKSR